ncbi:hypothetical protein EC973_000656 [Apophysomyces ossiformis]|uniref:Uncharacterized protein n=1 Tax=Apophysomyces ossiformis TaxID=679940 RepID=A0A8H7ESX1_9FUNG|nr:hypothetical protein EC973_000656 [Apophysomyces ossiformis]
MAAFVEQPQHRRRSSIDIRGQFVGSDILVALWDRPSEMALLAKRNARFYEAIEHYVKETKGDMAWEQFEELVYCSRKELPDREWMAALGEYLRDHPVFWSKFKESVGYAEEDGGEEEEPHEIDGYYHHHHHHHQPGIFQGERQFYDQYRRSMGTLPHLSVPSHDRHPTSPCSPSIAEEDEDNMDPQEDEEIEERANMLWVALRDHPQIQTQLPVLKSDFFKRAYQLMESASCSTELSNAVRRNSVLEDQDVDITMEHGEPRFQTCGEEQSDPYERFHRVICTTRRQQPDDEAWVEELLDTLEDWPELLEALRDVIKEVLP